MVVPKKEKNISREEGYEGSTTIPETQGSLSSSHSREEVDAKFKDINYILIGVILILLVMVATLIIDSFHINSAIYKEYSEKSNTLNILQDSNNELLKQNKQNQEIILELLNKK